MSDSRFDAVRRKMESEKLSAAAIRAFEHHFQTLAENRPAFLPEPELEPAEGLPTLESLPEATPVAREALARTVVLKLNGGLGTGMGLEKAKSLLPVKDGMNFLDLIAAQILRLRRDLGCPVRFMLMNSFSTGADTLAHLARYPELATGARLELLQGKVPKLDAATLAPVAWSADPDLEWCPPGHGDLYPSLLGSGLLDELLAQGCRYLFVSNSDNLGATLDLRLLEHFASSGQAFLMEATARTPADRKGGHLARRKSDGRLVLRESGQCRPEDEAAFQDITRHRFFNTNNLWINLAELRRVMEVSGGFLALPVIRNAKTVDPRDQASPKVIQLETAMGSAIEVFDNAGALVVPRSRFAPVKATCDLLALRSDAYELRDDGQIRLHADRGGQPPDVVLDPNHYKLVDQLDTLFPDGAPSLRACRELVVHGPVRFSAGITLRGQVTVRTASAKPVSLPPGTYADQTVELP